MVVSNIFFTLTRKIGKKLPQEYQLCNILGLRRMECTPTPFLNGIPMEDASFLAKKQRKCQAINTTKEKRDWTFYNNL